MFLSELTFPPTITKAGNFLAKYGYKRLGKSSSYGKIFYKEGDSSVLKLFLTSDVAYTAFVDVCRRHQNNPHFPRFSKGTMPIKDTKYSAIRTELLKEGHFSYLDRMCVYFYTIKYLKTSPDMITFYQDQPKHVPVSEYLESNFELSPTICKKMITEFMEMDERNDSLLQAFEIIVDELQSYRFDMRPDNLMMRDDIVVIIDPVTPRL